MSATALVYVHLLPSMIPTGLLQGGVAVVLDVLRATSVMVHALDAGASSIIPCLEIEEAKAEAARLLPGQAILAGERLGLPIDGFDFGNSPGSFTPDACHGKAIVMTTTNGTRAIHAALPADRIFIGSFLNLKATVQALKAEERPIHLICSGTNGLVSLEDSLLAGAIAYELGIGNEPTGNDEARLCLSAWLDSSREPLVEVIGRGMGGRRVQEIGLAADIAVAVDRDRFDFAAEVVRNPIRIVRSNDAHSRST